jgi:acyl-CoA thioesterase-1
LQVGCNSNKGTKTTAEQEVSTEESVSAPNKKSIIFFGNSLTAGYGIDPDDAFPALIQERLDSLGYSYHVVNAGLSGETTASGLNRIEWVLREKPEIFILELGGNDGLRGIDLDETRKNLQAMVGTVKKIAPEATIILAGMMIPPNMGEKYTTEFREVFPEIARRNELPLIPFLLKDVGGEPDLNLPDMIHQNEKGHKIVAENVWNVLKNHLPNRQ